MITGCAGRAARQSRTNHATTWAGSQGWFDLLFAQPDRFTLMLPRARAVGMRPFPWADAVVTTACVALLPMLARLLWLEARQGEGHSIRDGAARLQLTSL
jgi:hypothetical protein